MQVSNKPEIVIKDACILFDLVDLGLLQSFFLLEVQAYTTPQVIAEITDEEQWLEISAIINNGSLKIDNEGDLSTISNIYDKYPGLSLPDSSVLELALRKRAIIYSSDGSLRKISVKNELVVRGILWIIEALYVIGVLTKEEAVDKLNLYESINQRSPLAEIKKLITKITAK